MRPVLSGSGKFVTPWARTHRENCRACAAVCRCCVADGTREQMLAGALSRREFGVAGRESSKGDLVELSAVIGVGEVRHAMCTHAAGESERFLGC